METFLGLVGRTFDSIVWVGLAIWFQRLCRRYVRWNRKNHGVVRQARPLVLCRTNGGYVTTNFSEEEFREVAGIFQDTAEDFDITVED